MRLLLLLGCCWMLQGGLGEEHGFLKSTGSTMETSVTAARNAALPRLESPSRPSWHGFQAPHDKELYGFLSNLTSGIFFLFVALVTVACCIRTSNRCFDESSPLPSRIDTAQGNVMDASDVMEGHGGIEDGGGRQGLKTPNSKVEGTLQKDRKSVV